MAETRESVIAQVTAKGDEVRQAKKDKAPKDVVTPLVDELIALKKHYVDVFSEPFPTPKNARSGKKGDKNRKGGGDTDQKSAGGAGGAVSASLPPKIPDEKSLNAEFKKLGISSVMSKSHEPVVTVEEMMEHAMALPGGKAKNLFLKDKKKNLFLVSALHDTETPTKMIEKKYGVKSGTLRLAHDADLLMSKLGVIKGAVSPLCAINDVGGTVKVVLDEHFKSFKSLCFHPLTNAATISIATVDLVKFLDACGHSPEWFDFGAPLGAESQALMQAAPPSASTTPEPTPAASPDCASGTTPLQEDTVQVSQLPSREALEDVGFYLCVGMRVWVAGTGSGAAAAAGVVVRAPSDQVGVWTVRTAADGEEQLASWQQIWPRSVFTPVASPPAPKVSNDDVSSPLCSSPGLEGVPGEIHCKLVAPVDGKSAADGGRWTVRIQAGSSKGQPSARVVCTLLPPAGGKSAEDGGKWAVRIHASIGDGGETDTGSGSTQLVTPSPLVIPDTPRLASPAPPPFGAEDPVERAGTVCSELGLSVEKRQHQACVASEGKTSNQHHHEVLSDVDGHIVVTLFLKGQKKKELIMLIKKPASKLNLKAFGRAPEVGVVGNAVRMADAKALQASIGMEPDFVSPLSLVNALDKGVVLHKVLFDAALQDGKPLWCLPPMVNTASWGWSLLDAVRFAQGCGQSVGLIELEAGSAALALAPRPVVRSSASSLPVQLVPPADGKGAAEGGKWTVNIGACLGGAAAAASAVEQAKGARLAKLSLVNAPLVNPGPSQPWWSGKPMSPCCVVDKLAELGLSSDDVQAATMEEEIASWCTSLFVKCKKTKKHFMITSRPGVKVDLKKVAKQIGAKELRIAQDKAALGFTSDYTGCLTAMSVLGDREGAVASVLDKQILDLGNDCRMCSGCDDFRDHTQHHISSVPPAMLLQMLEDSGHPPKLVDM